MVGASMDDCGENAGGTPPRPYQLRVKFAEQTDVDSEDNAVPCISRGRLYYQGLVQEHKDRGSLDAFRKIQNDRAKLYRKSMSEDVKKRDREGARNRMSEYRKRKKAKGEADLKTRTGREKGEKAKQDYREKMKLYMRERRQRQSKEVKEADKEKKAKREAHLKASERGEKTKQDYREKMKLYTRERRQRQSKEVKEADTEKKAKREADVKESERGQKTKPDYREKIKGTPPGLSQLRQYRVKLEEQSGVDSEDNAVPCISRGRLYYQGLVQEHKDRGSLDTFRKIQNDRAKLYRQSMSEDVKKRDREGARHRMSEYRKRKKAKREADLKTRTGRERGEKAKQDYREKMKLYMRERRQRQSKEVKEADKEKKAKREADLKASERGEKTKTDYRENIKEGTPPGPSQLRLHRVKLEEQSGVDSEDNAVPCISRGRLYYQGLVQEHKDRGSLDTFRKIKNDRAKLYRKSMSEDVKKRDREGARNRMSEYRKRKKAKGEADPKARTVRERGEKTKQDYREKMKLYMRERRQRQSKEVKEADKENRRRHYAAKKATKSSAVSREPVSGSPSKS